MVLVLYVRFFIIFYIIADNVHQCSSLNNVTNSENMLKEKLFQGCNCHMRPVLNSSDAVHVYFDFKPLYIRGLDGVSQVFTIYSWLGTKWHIPFLTWKPDDFDGIDYITVRADEIWFPNIAIINSVDGIYGDMFTTADREGKLNHDGMFRINRPGISNTICLMDIKYFPFDTQVCHIELDSWTLQLSRLEFMQNGSIFETNQMRPNGQWKVIGSWIQETRTSINYKTLSFVFRLKRKPQFVAINFILPCLAIFITELLIFVIPPDAGEKISLGITLLLAQTVFQLVMQGDLPETSDQYPVVNMFIILAMMVSGLEILCSVIVLNLHHRSEKQDISPFIKEYVIKMGRLFGIYKGKNKDTNKDQMNDDTVFSTEENVTWIEVSRVLNCMFFYLFLLITIGLIVACLLISTLSKDDTDEPRAKFGYYWI